MTAPGRPVRVALALLLLAIQAVAGTAGASSRSLTEEDSGGFVILAVGEGFNLSLGANPSTGYGWSIVGLDRSVADVAEQSFQSPTPVPGAGGSSNWTFEGKRDGETTLRLEYGRSRDGARDPVRTFSVHIVVGAGNVAWNLSFLAAVLVGALAAAELARRRRGKARAEGGAGRAPFAGRLLPIRAAGALGLGGLAAMTAGLAGSLSMYPRFSFWDSNLSDLGVSAGSAFFNWGLLACGVLGAFLALGARLHLSGDNPVRRAGFTVLVAAMAALGAIGILTEAFARVHFFTAVAFFVLFPLASLLVGLSLAKDGALRWPGRLALFSAAMGVLAWFLPGEGWAISELAAAVPGMLWLGLLSAMMAKGPPA